MTTASVRTLTARAVSVPVSFLLVHKRSRSARRIDVSTEPGGMDGQKRLSDDLLSGRREGASGTHEPSQRCDGAHERQGLVTLKMTKLPENGSICFHRHGTRGSLPAEAGWAGAGLGPSTPAAR
jgi:hypothetical protein